MNLDQNVVSVAQQYSAAYPAIPWPVFYTWFVAEGVYTLGWNNNNPLNLSYSPLQSGSFSYVGSHGETNTMAIFPDMATSAKAVAQLLTNSYTNGPYGNFGSIQSNGNDATPYLNAIQNSSWAGNHYDYNLGSVYSGIFGNLNFPSGTTGSGNGSGSGVGNVPVIGGIVNGASGAAGAIGNLFGSAFGAIGGTAGNGAGVVGGAAGQAAGAVGNAITSYLSGVFKYIGKWIILALIAIGIFILFLHLVTGGKEVDAVAAA